MKSRNHCDERRNCWQPSFSPFSTVFSTGLLLSILKSRDCVINVNATRKLLSAGAFIVIKCKVFVFWAEPHSAVIQDLRTGGHWFDPRLGQYSFHGLMIVIATGFIPLSLLSIVWTMCMWEKSHWLEKNIVLSTG